jgi:sugar lactone lactonase YvrE
MHNPVRLLLAAALGGGILLSAGTAATAAPTSPSMNIPAVATASVPMIHGSAPTLHPEGIAWDPTRRAFLVGSVPHGTVSIVSRTGQVRTLVSDARMTSTFGIHVDAARDRLLVVYQAGVGVFDLRTGKAEKVIPIGTAPNDLTIDPQGHMYVTDPGSDTIFKVDVAGHVSVVTKAPVLASQGFGINGIVWHPGGYLLVGRYDNGHLLKVRLTGRREITEVKLPQPLVGADGLTLRPDGRLVIVANSIAAAGQDTVTVLFSVGDWTSARVASNIAWPVVGPTAATVAPQGTFVLDGLLQKFFVDKSPVDDFYIGRI